MNLQRLNFTRSNFEALSQKFSNFHDLEIISATENLSDDFVVIEAEGAVYSDSNDEECFEERFILHLSGAKMLRNTIKVYDFFSVSMIRVEYYRENNEIIFASTFGEVCFKFDAADSFIIVGFDL